MTNTISIKLIHIYLRMLEEGNNQQCDSVMAAS